MTIFNPAAIIAFKLTGKKLWLSSEELVARGLRMARILGHEKFIVGRRDGKQGNGFEVPLIDITSSGLIANDVTLKFAPGPNDQIIQVKLNAIDYFSESIPAGDWPVIRSIIEFIRITFRPSALYYAADHPGMEVREITSGHIAGMDLEYAAFGRVDTFEFDDEIVHSSPEAKMDAEHHRHAKCGCCSNPMVFTGIIERDSATLEQFECRYCGEHMECAAGDTESGMWFGQSGKGYPGPVEWTSEPELSEPKDFDPEWWLTLTDNGVAA